MGVKNELPPKREVAIALLETSSVYVHLDPRGAGVHVPAWFKKQPQLVLQVGLNMPVPIPDLDVGEEALSCTLSFNRRPEHCWIPWSAIYGLVGEDGRGMIWPEDVPPEVAAQAQGRPATPKERHLRAVAEGSATQATATQAPATQAAATQAAATQGSPEASEQTAKSAESEGAPEAQGRARKAGRKASAAGAGTKKRSSKAATPPQGSTEPSAAPSKDGASGEGRPRRELPPYLRIVK